MTLEHVGIAIASPSDAAALQSLLGIAPYKSEAVASEGVRTAFFGDGGVAGAAPKMELVEATSPDSTIATYVEKRGPGLHHLAFEVDALDRHVERARALGIRVLGEPRPGADSKRIVFLHPKDTGGVLVELLESVRPERRWQDVASPAGRIAVQVTGLADAPPLVVFHAALGSTELETDRLIAVWERTHRVYGVDLPGHGRSGDLDTASPDWDDYVSAAIAVVDHFGLSAAHVFGFSMGAGVALALALARPAAVGRLVVHGANVQWSAAEVEAMTSPMAPDRIERDTPFWARRLAEVHGARWPGLVAQIVAFTSALPDRWMTDADLAGVACPTLVSAGDADRFFDVRHAVGLWRAIPDARLRVIPGLDHPIQGVDVPTFAADVERFLLGG
ncbi:alpha/beta fold hydrolase [Rubrivirga sp. IMCC43871]|uniref:alpha/beta fold hydrolase n=1 Tax=Rubrivirga sp. IMCC43871 TaxID=3391575 RepID=UPI00398FCF2A